MSLGLKKISEELVSTASVGMLNEFKKQLIVGKLTLCWLNLNLTAFVFGLQFLLLVAYEYFSVQDRCVSSIIENSFVIIAFWWFSQLGGFFFFFVRSSIVGGLLVPQSIGCSLPYHKKIKWYLKNVLEIICLDRFISLILPTSLCPTTHLKCLLLLSGIQWSI